MTQTLATPKPKTPFPRAKIRKAVATIMPPQRAFTLHVNDSSVGTAKIVRIVTDAWKNEHAAERILRIMDAVNSKLNRDEQRRVLRYSVLTPEEYRQVVLGK